MRILTLAWPPFLATALLALGLTTAPLGAQSVFPTYSIDYQGPTIGMFDSMTGVPITEGDILTVPMAGLAPVPAIFITGGPGGLHLIAHPAAVGHPPGQPGQVEVDALSYGTDFPVTSLTPPVLPYNWFFGVDEYAAGFPGGFLPHVLSEGATGFLEAGADIYEAYPPGALTGPLGPPPAGTPMGGNTLRFDGDGSFPGFRSLFLIEPNPPTPGPLDGGDNLDALDVDTVPVPAIPVPVYFSLDSMFFDPLEGVPNTGSAFANGTFAPFSGGDVLVSIVGGPPFTTVFAPAFTLGLDLAGFDTDDLDALALWENGSGQFEPSNTPYDWLSGATDMLFFSVRRNSAIIGTLDSFFGIAIEEGDILFPFGGPGTPPGIWIAAENLGLMTVRTHGGGPFGFADDLVALDVAMRQQQFVRGDVNADGLSNIGDPIFLLSSVFIPGSPPLPCLDAADVNDDGFTDIADAIYGLGFLFGTGPTPPVPYPNCGLDPTFDSLDCKTFPPCPSP